MVNKWISFNVKEKSKKKAKIQPDYIHLDIDKNETPANKEQIKAIKSTGKTIIVEALAGSGKTKVKE